MSQGFINGNFGPLTLESMHLFGKSDDYREGYRAGKSTGHEGRLNERADYAARRGGDYLSGFITGKAVEMFGPRILSMQLRHSGSYRDPDLSRIWLYEAEWKARQGGARAMSYNRDYRKIIKRLVAEVRKLRGWA